MLVPDDQFYWESYKHEENLAASRGKFFSSDSRCFSLRWLRYAPRTTLDQLSQ